MSLEKSTALDHLVALIIGITFSAALIAAFQCRAREVATQKTKPRPEYIAPAARRVPCQK